MISKTYIYVSINQYAANLHKLELETESNLIYIK